MFRVSPRATALRVMFRRPSKVERPIVLATNSVQALGGDGKPQRQEDPVLTAFGIVPFNFVIKRLPYDPTVEAQIKQQQQIAMDVQTAIADARKAEQNAITVAEQGKADAAKAKWMQETIKAKFVTEAEQKREVAKLGSEEAEFYRVGQLRRAEGDATYRAKVMAADGALEIKLGALKEIHAMYAGAMKDYKGQWVPSVQMGQNGQQGGNAALDMINLLTAKLARDIGVEVGAMKK